ncbi:FAD-binding protein [Streptomyces sp. NPDC012637]|uniref:FAD-binding protein n=1 Tax=Streptomyces sp. NPDC012637 TaxID=3364842 RepID=UPI0036F14870
MSTHDRLTGFRTAFPVRPDRHVEATGPDGVRAAVRYAAEHGLAVAVQSTGHGRGGPVEGGLLVDTRRMDENHPGGALAAEPAVPNSVPYRGAGWLVRALHPLDAAGPAPVRELHARVQRVLAPRTVGRAVNFVFGDRERTAGPYDSATAKRLAAVKSELDPASLFGAFGKSGRARPSVGLSPCGRAASRRSAGHPSRARP